MRRLMQVAEVGRRVGSGPPARMEKEGESSRKPSIGGRGDEVTNLICSMERSLSNGIWIFVLEQRARVENVRVDDAASGRTT